MNLKGIVGCAEQKGVALTITPRVINNRPTQASAATNHAGDWPVGFSGLEGLCCPPDLRDNSFKT